jgi:hypothetical protein
MTTKTKTERPVVMPVGDAGVMQQYDQLHSTLSATHSQIPQLLARQRTLERALGVNETEELRRQLADVMAERESAARRRMAAVSSLLALEAMLQSERLALEAQRQQYAAEAVAAFQTRYRGAVAALQQCWEEGAVLSATLRTEVQMDLPVKVMESVRDGGASRAVPVRGADVAVSVDAAAAKLGAKLDRLDGALAAVNAVRQAQTFDQHHHRLGLLRGAGAEHGGVFRVLAEFNCLTDGLPFRAGDLIDGSLIGSGMAHRLQTGRRFIEPERLSAAA